MPYHISANLKVCSTFLQIPRLELTKAKYIFMHKIERSELPENLREYLDECREVLSRELESITSEKERSESIRKAWNGLNKEKKKALKNELLKMSGDCCCYCESYVSATGYGDIEHQRPKRTFPELTFQWENLHYSCHLCNNQKGKKYDFDNPILDVCVDEPSEHYFFSNEEIKYCYMEPKTLRGATTIDHCRLNRKSLLNVRREYFDLYKLIIPLLINAPENDANRINLIKQILEHARHGYNYCSVYREIISRNKELFGLVSWKRKDFIFSPPGSGIPGCLAAFIMYKTGGSHLAPHLHPMRRRTSI